MAVFLLVIFGSAHLQPRWLGRAGVPRGSWRQVKGTLRCKEKEEITGKGQLHFMAVTQGPTVGV